MKARGINWDSRIRQIKLRDLHILEAVVQQGSMAKAAPYVGVSQPAVSLAIAELEAILGVRLLDRGPGGVMPTLFGEVLLKRGNEIFDALKQSIRDIEFLTDPGAGEITLGASESYISGGYLAAAISRLSQQYPKIAVHVVEANTAELQFQELRDRQVDVMFGRVSGELDAEFAFETLYQEPIVVGAARSHRLAGRASLDLRHLLDEAWILAPPDTAVRDLVAGAFRAGDLPPPRVALTTYSMQLRMQLLATGKYLSSVPASLLRYNAERWSLCALPVSLGPPLPVVAVTLKNRTLSSAVQIFIEAARHVATIVS